MPGKWKSFLTRIWRSSARSSLLLLMTSFSLRVRSIWSATCDGTGCLALLVEVASLALSCQIAASGAHNFSEINTENTAKSHRGHRESYSERDGVSGKANLPIGGQ